MRAFEYTIIAICKFNCVNERESGLRLDPMGISSTSMHDLTGPFPQFVHFSLNFRQPLGERAITDGESISLGFGFEPLYIYNI